MFDAIFNWNEIVSRGVDATTYLIMAAVGTGLFLIRLGLAFFGGDHGDGDFDTDVHGGDIADSDAGFSFFSVLSILAFFMGAGWMGLACLFDWGLPRLASAFISAGFGFIMMTAASGLMWATTRLNQEARYDPATAVGATGRVYLTVPERGAGHGQVEVSVSGRRKILSAVSEGPELQPFTDVIVISVQDDETLVVKPKYPGGDPSASA
jgi:hypothetical protein